jgi:tetratricopeptide (TPR) repeat protein
LTATEVRHAHRTEPDSLGGRLRERSRRAHRGGRREEALAAIEEAIAIRRGLAASRLDTFRPVLANSLNNLSLRLSDLGRREEALAAAKEAVGILEPYFTTQPGAFREWMETIVATYRRLVEQAGGEADLDLDSISRILETKRS